MSNEVMPHRIVTRHTVDLSAAPPPGHGRNVIIGIDGTWNEERSPDGGAGAPSNVRKLYDCLAPDSDAQIARYFRGVGNHQDNSWWRRRWFGLTGGDERRIRCAALATINKEYRPGDNFFIVGFSRGAACARLLASDLHDRGLHQTLDITSRRCMNHLTRQVETRIVAARGSGRNIRGASVPVRFLGCWDTVGAFVLPLRYPNFRLLDGLIGGFVSLWRRLRGDIPFRDQTVSPSVRRAVHCVAIDETRNAFLPTLMNRADHIEEVWFPGVHADVGGGYTRDGLSRVALQFMVNRLDRCVREDGLRPIQWDREALARLAGVTVETPFDFHFHGLGGRLLGRRIRRIRMRSDGQQNDVVKPRIHWSVAEVWQSDQVYARRAGRDRHWRIDYRPFNIAELNDALGGLRQRTDDWPFEWVDRPGAAYV